MRLGLGNMSMISHYESVSLLIDLLPTFKLLKIEHSMESMVGQGIRLNLGTGFKEALKIIPYFSGTHIHFTFPTGPHPQIGMIPAFTLMKG